MIRLKGVRSLKVFMSLQNNNKLYSTPEERINTVSGTTGNWWAMLQRAEAEYTANVGKRSNFQFWLTEHYGIKIYYDYDGILPTYDVVDEQKYFLFKLKYV